MAPALTSDAALSDKETRVPLPPATGPDTDLNSASSVTVYVPTRHGRECVNLVNRERRSRKLSKQTSNQEALIGPKSTLQKVDVNEENILRVSKKMNPNDGSSQKDVIRSGRRSRAKNKGRKQNAKDKTMCGKNTKSLNPSDAVGLTNGNNKLHTKESTGILKKQDLQSGSACDIGLLTSSPTSDVSSVSKISLHKPKDNESPHLDIKTSESVSIQSCPGTSQMERCAEDKCGALASRQKILVRRATRLVSRIRRLQARQAITHSREQITGFVDQQKRQIEKRMTKQEVSADSTLDLKDAQNMSTSALVNLVQKWQAQQPVSRRHSKQESEKLLKVDEEMCRELEQVSGQLLHSAHHLHTALDSDATESSSGGESCDEADFDYDWGDKTQPALNKRVDWRWIEDRAQIASRWTWLQAQVSDLEYRIRQQTDIYKQIRQKKGEVTLGEVPHIISSSGVAVETTRLHYLQESGQSPANVSPIVTNVREQSASLKQQLGNIYTPSPPTSGASTLSSLASANVATSDVLTVTTTSQSQSSLASHTPACTTGVGSTPCSPYNTENDSSCIAARCRPVLLGKYRKRKLLRTPSFSHRSEIKSARLTSTVQCQCYPPATPCALCGGRVNYTADQQQAQCRPVSERVALLDHSYHQVLSLQEDVPLSVHFEGLLKTGEWHRLHSRSGHVRPFKIEKRRGQYQIKEKRTKKTASLEVLSRIKNKYAAERVLSALPLSPQKKRLSRISGIRMRKKKAALHDVFRKKDRLRNSDSVMLRDMKEHARRKRAESAYDINNIVIPYSIAASTRVQKLQYKEILTPSWREVDSEGRVEGKARSRRASVASNCDATTTFKQTSIAGTVIERDGDGQTAEQLTDDEDVSDAAVLARHDRCEVEERHKFLSYTGTTPSNHAQAHKRTRGRASESAPSSGVMTPDPSSPDIPEQAQGATPPATPATSEELERANAHVNSPVYVHTPVKVEVEPDAACADMAFVQRRRATSISAARRRASHDFHHSPHYRSRTDSSHFSHHHHHHPSDDPPCWPLRHFPLSEADYNHLFLERPPSENMKYALRGSRAIHVPRTSTSREPVGAAGGSGDYLLDSPPTSPASTGTSLCGGTMGGGSVTGGGASSTSGTSAGGGDNTGDEWTVKSVKPSSLVLKIAKR